jgi:hypothetical protein
MPVLPGWLCCVVPDGIRFCDPLVELGNRSPVHQAMSVRDTTIPDFETDAISPLSTPTLRFSGGRN